MTNSAYTHIIAILDRSGSMHSIQNDTEGGFNAFVQDQHKVEGLCTLTLVQFDDKYNVVYTMKDLDQVPPLRLIPRGSTALLDAIGRTVVKEGEKLAKMEEDERPGTVICLVMTDGMENASREWTREKVAELLNTQKDTYNWKFIFMGSNQDAVTEGKSMGFDADYAVTFDGANTIGTYSITSQNIAEMRRGGAGAYTKEQREEAAKE